MRWVVLGLLGLLNHILHESLGLVGWFTELSATSSPCEVRGRMIGGIELQFGTASGVVEDVKFSLGIKVVLQIHRSAS